MRKKKLTGYEIDGKLRQLLLEVDKMMELDFTVLSRQVNLMLL